MKFRSREYNSEACRLCDTSSLDLWECLASKPKMGELSC